MTNSKRSTNSLQGGDRESPITEELHKIALLTITSGTHFAKFQSETSDSVIAEISQRQIEVLERSCEPALMRWSHLGETGLQRSIGIARAWLEITTRTQEAMLEAMHECLGQSGHVLSEQHSRQAKAFKERRFKNSVIQFPERRLAA